MEDNLKQNKKMEDNLKQNKRIRPPNFFGKTRLTASKKMEDD